MRSPKDLHVRQFAMARRQLHERGRRPYNNLLDDWNSQHLIASFALLQGMDMQRKRKHLLMRRTPFSLKCCTFFGTVSSFPNSTDNKEGTQRIRNDDISGRYCCSGVSASKLRNDEEKNVHEQNRNCAYNCIYKCIAGASPSRTYSIFNLRKSN